MSTRGNKVIGKDTLDSQQILIVISNGWNEVTGTLYCYEKINHIWQLMFSNAVVVGIKGMGLGRGIRSFDISGAPLKKEGDMRSPSGIFKIGTAFGYARQNEVSWLNFPYLEATSKLLCIDDGISTSYNKLVFTDKKKKDWSTFEEMHRKDNLYKWGLFVEHNFTDSRNGKGSCIFIHIWRNRNSGTAGCSAMSEEDILRLLRWIDSAKSPILIQFPKKEYDNVSEKFDLPRL